MATLGGEASFVMNVNHCQSMKKIVSLVTVTPFDDLHFVEKEDDMAIVQSKMIVICHYRGWWFDSNEDGSMACGDWEAYDVDADENMLLSDFKKEVAETVGGCVDGMLVNCRHRLLKRPSVTQAVANLPPAERDLQNLTPLNEVVSIETTNETTPIPNPTCHEPHLAAKQWENLITCVGQRFSSIVEIRETLKKYAITHAFNYEYKKKESKRLIVKCKSKKCQWRMHASKLANTQVICIKTMTATHSCQAGSVITALRAQGSFFGEMLMEKVIDNQKIKPKELGDKLKSEYEVDVNYSKARRAREYALLA